MTSGREERQVGLRDSRTRKRKAASRSQRLGALRFDSPGINTPDLGVNLWPPVIGPFRRAIYTAALAEILAYWLAMRPVLVRSRHGS